MRRLLIRPGAIGDLIVSLPALESLRTDYLEVWVAEQNVPLIRFADAVRSIGSTGLDLLEFVGRTPWSAADALVGLCGPAQEAGQGAACGPGGPPHLVERLRSFDSIVSWYGATRPEFREAVERLGLRFQFLPALPSGMHAVDFFLRQVGAAGSPAVPRIDIGQVPREDFAVIHPFASSPRKRWPLAKFREVASRLPLPVNWCAGPEEPLAGAVRIDDLYELACWLGRARVYIGNDSGISHLAAAAGTPTIVLFGPTDPAVWAPRGSRVLHPMDSIEPADVIAAVEAL